MFKKCFQKFQEEHVQKIFSKISGRNILKNFFKNFRKNMFNCFNLLLVSLAAFDTWYLFGSILVTILRNSQNL
jgi:hypothetical protein